MSKTRFSGSKSEEIIIPKSETPNNTDTEITIPKEPAPLSMETVSNSPLSSYVPPS